MCIAFKNIWIRRKHTFIMQSVFPFSKCGRLNIEEWREGEEAEQFVIVIARHPCNFYMSHFCTELIPRPHSWPFTVFVSGRLETRFNPVRFKSICDSFRCLRFIVSFTNEFEYENSRTNCNIKSKIASKQQHSYSQVDVMLFFALFAFSWFCPPSTDHQPPATVINHNCRQKQ